MGKRYDWWVTPQNTPRFQKRRMLFVVATGILAVNLIVTGVFLSAHIGWYLLAAFAAALFAGVQYFDNRRTMWAWGYVWSWVVICFAASATLFLWYKAYWWFVGYGVELMAFVVLAVWKLKKRTANPRSK